MKKLTTRLTAMLLSGMLVIGSVPGAVFATDTGETAEYAQEVYTEGETAEESSEAADAGAEEEVAEASEGNVADTSEEAAAQYYTVTLDANGGYFENEWDDSTGEIVEQAEVVEKHVPVDGTVTTFPVNINPDGQTMLFAGWSLERDGELVITGDEEYTPVDNCVLYAVWEAAEAEDAALAETGEQEEADEENSEQADTAQESEEVDAASGDAVTAEEGTVAEDTASEANTDPETESEQTVAPSQEAVSADEDVENISEESSDAAEAEGETQPELTDLSKEEETVREDAAKGVVESGTFGANGDNLTWTLDEEGTLTISGMGKMEDFSESNVPWTLNRAEIKKVEIKNGVTSIGVYAFSSCESLKSVTIPDSVTKIWNMAFKNCRSLESIILPNNLTSIELGIFLYCTSLKNVTIPNSVTMINGSAFYGCTSLESITIPSSIRTIYSQAFLGCTSLESIFFNGNALNINLDVFKNVTATAYYPANDSTWTEDERKNYGGNITWAPWDPVTGIIYGTSGICGDNLTWTLDEEGTLTISGTGGMEDYQCTFNGSTTICTYPWLADKIKNIIINFGVTNIGENSFRLCKNLRNVNLPNSIMSIKDCAFYGSNNLTTVNIPNSVTNIGHVAFSGCTSLNNITISNSVTNIGVDAFYGCTSLSSIYFNGNAPSISSTSFTNVTATAYYPANDPTWTEDVRQNYGGNITWVEWDPSDNSIEKIDSGFELQRDNNSFNHSHENFLENDEKLYCLSDSLYWILKNRANPIQKLYLFNHKHILPWDGSCEGLETTMALVFSKHYEFLVFDSGNFWNIRFPLRVDGLRNVINYYQLLYNTILKPDYSVSNKQDVRDFCRALVNEAKKGKPFIFNYLYNEKQTLSDQEVETLKQHYSNYSTSGGHSVIVCGYKYVLTQDGVKEHQIKIYDCNDRTNYHWMTIPDDYSSFSYQDSNMHTFSITLQNENRLNLRDVYTTLTLRTFDSIEDEVLPDNYFVETRTSAIPNKKKSLCDENKLLTVSDINDSDMSYVIISFDRPFVLTNGAGESLVYDGIETSGDMPIFNSFITGGENHVTLQFETTKSSSFVVSGCDEGISLFTQVGNTVYSVDTNNASTVTISEESGVDITGDNISFVSGSIDSEAVDNIVTVSGETTGNCNIVRKDENVIVNSDSQIENIGISTENTEIFNEYTTVASEDNYIINDEADVPVVTTRDEDGVFKPVEVINVNDLDVPTKLEITSTDITIEEDSYIYTGEPIVPATTVKGSAGEELSEDTDYTINYADNINAGTATVTITGIGNYQGTVTKSFTIKPAAIDIAEISEIEPITYTGKEQTPVPTVKIGNQTLTKDTDYTLSYTDNTNIGTATVTITGKGNYTGTLSKTFTISAASIANATVSGISNKTYTGSALTQNPTVKVGDQTLTKDTDYTVSYANNTKVGTATVKITGKGNYTGTVSKTFKINGIPVSNATVTGISNKAYTGSARTQNPIVKVGDQTLKKGTDYIITYANNTKVGTATVKITGKGNYTGTISKTFKISRRSIAKATISGIVNKTYTGSAKTQNPTVKVGDKTLKKGTDYTVSYANNINVGTATVTITGKGNYASKKTVSFKINKATQSITAKAGASRVSVGKTTTVSITGNKGKKTYKSSNTAIATVTSAGKVTAKKVGTVKITATSAATANYKAASKIVTIKVVPAATASLTAANQVTGIKLTWKKVTGANGYKVYRGSTLIKTITSGSTVTYADTKANTNGTKYTYKVVAKSTTGDSTLSKSRAIYRVARPAITSLKNSVSKKMTVKWGKNAKATGYQIQYSTSKSFATGNKTATITSASTVSKVLGSLTKGKTYYVRIRTYKTVGSTKYWSTWSAAKSVKISK